MSEHIDAIHLAAGLEGVLWLHDTLDRAKVVRSVETIAAGCDLPLAEILWMTGRCVLEVDGWVDEVRSLCRQMGP